MERDDLCNVDHKQAVAGQLVWVNGAAHHSHWADRLALEVYIHPAQQQHIENWTLTLCTQSLLTAHTVSDRAYCIYCCFNVACHSNGLTWLPSKCS